MSDEDEGGTKANPSTSNSKAWEKKCDDEYDQAYSAIQKNQEEYDKQLITLSAAFVTFTISFINNAVPLRSATCLWLLYVSLSLMAACLLSVLVSYQVSIHYQYKAAEYWSKRKDKSCSPVFPSRGATVVRCWNVINGGIFATAIVLAIVFVVHNLRRESEMNKRISTAIAAHAMDGLSVKLPADEVRGQNIKIPVSQGNIGTNAAVQRPSDSPSREQTEQKK